MNTDVLKVPKSKRKVSLWIHPEGQVIASLFLREQSLNHEGEETPLELLNEEQAFVVVEKSHSGEVFFYNRNSIIRIEYDDEPPADIPPIPCQLDMMDGSQITGEIREDLPQDYSRLFDYLNKGNDRFIRLFTSENEACLVNKSYIINVVSQ